MLNRREKKGYLALLYAGGHAPPFPEVLPVPKRLREGQGAPREPEAEKQEVRRDQWPRGTCNNFMFSFLKASQKEIIW